MSQNCCCFCAAWTTCGCTTTIHCNTLQQYTDFIFMQGHRRVAKLLLTFCYLDNVGLHFNNTLQHTATAH